MSSSSGRRPGRRGGVASPKPVARNPMELRQAHGGDRPSQKHKTGNIMFQILETEGHDCPKPTPKFSPGMTVPAPIPRAGWPNGCPAGPQWRKTKCLVCSGRVPEGEAEPALAGPRSLFLSLSSFGHSPNEFASVRENDYCAPFNSICTIIIRAYICQDERL
jgi:hypothetical protein